MGYRNSQKALLALPSATYAMRAGELLARQGIRVKIVTLDPEMTKRGCAYGIELDHDIVSKARNILTSHGIQVRIPGGG